MEATAPQSLHPEIDQRLCIGSLSCVRACPEGDILGVIDGRARLIRGANCIGHGRCARECPVGAIRLVIGTSERGVDLPELDAAFESSRAGVHVAGELGGMGLIRNAVTQGLEVAELLAARRVPPPTGGVEVAIVGSGPAGLATAFGCRQHGLGFRLLEQDSLGGAVAAYPRQKVVMTDPLALPYVGRLPRRTLTKEALLALWQRGLSRAGIRVEEGVRATGLTGADGDFTLQTSNGPVRAAKVVLATGRRGTPRRLGVPGEDSGKVFYRLVDPEQYAGKQVLVVGGGDSALEAAIALAKTTGAAVALSYRGAALGKCREANRKTIEELAAAGRVQTLMSSQVTAIRPGEVRLDTPSGERTFANDFVIAALGGELPLEFLAKMGVSVKRFHGEEPHARISRKDRSALEERGRRRFALALGSLGALLVCALWVYGADYYPLSRIERLRSPEHSALRPAGPWGHGVGVVATAFMLSNFLYAVRKRLGFLKGRTSIRGWLTFHMFVGFMSPLVILFHAAFQANNLLAAGTFGALLIVVATGVIGRFIYGLVPTEGGTALEQAEVRTALERTKGEIEAALATTGGSDAASQLLDRLTRSTPRSFPSALAHLALLRWRIGSPLEELRRALGDEVRFRELRRAALRLSRLRVQTDFLRGFKRLLSAWRLVHATLAVLLVAAIAAHIGVSVYLGYRWILR